MTTKKAPASNDETAIIPAVPASVAIPISVVAHDGQEATVYSVDTSTPEGGFILSLMEQLDDADAAIATLKSRRVVVAFRDATDEHLFELAELPPGDLKVVIENGPTMSDYGLWDLADAEPRVSGEPIDLVTVPRFRCAVTGARCPLVEKDLGFCANCAQYTDEALGLAAIKAKAVDA